jgi:hypothetical protein
MGIRSIEKRLAAELCFEAMVEAVNDYLDECRRAGRYLPPHEHLITPKVRAGFYPQGLLSIKHFISREEVTARAERRDGTGEGRLHLPGADSLIEAVMYPFPIVRLRAATHRKMLKLQGKGLLHHGRSQCDRMRT